ncbi:MAG: recombination-associated protein RdgC [Myxococcales bacterium]|nr:recombination-associated protein RdgC [Myxococcales bacterium]
MPLLKGSVSFARFHAAPPATAQAEHLLEGLRLRAFEPIALQGEEERAAGFVELENHTSTAFAPSATFQGDWLVCAWRIDTIRISAAQLNEELKAWIQDFENKNERAPSRYERSEAKMALRKELRAVTPPTTKTFDVAWNLGTGALQIFTLSRKLVDEILVAFDKSFDVTPLPRSPQVLFDEAGLQDAHVKPTPELCWPGLSLV